MPSRDAVHRVLGADFYRYTVYAATATGKPLVIEEVWAPTPHDAAKLVLYPETIHDYEWIIPAQLSSYTPASCRAKGWEWGLKHNKLGLRMPSALRPWRVVDPDGNETVCQRRIRRPEMNWIAKVAASRTKQQRWDRRGRRLR